VLADDFWDGKAASVEGGCDERLAQDHGVLRAPQQAPHAPLEPLTL
jgi:hypothetical protein